MICAKCGSPAVFYTDTCDVLGRKDVFYLCPEHQKEYYDLTMRFLGRLRI